MQAPPGRPAVRDLITEESRWDGSEVKYVSACADAGERPVEIRTSLLVGARLVRRHLACPEAKDDSIPSAAGTAV